MFSPREKQERALTDEQQLRRGGGAAARRSARGQARRCATSSWSRAFTRIHSKAEALLLSLSRAEQSAGEAQPKKAAGAKDVKGVLGEMHARLGKLVREEEQTLGELRDERRKSRSRCTAARRGRSRRATRSTWPSSSATSSCSTISSASSGSRSCSPSPTRWRQTRDRLKQLMAEYKKTRSEETEEGDRARAARARAQAGRAAGRRRSGWPPSCPISSSTTRRWATTTCRSSSTRCARCWPRATSTRRWPSWRSCRSRSTR